FMFASAAAVVLSAQQPAPAPPAGQQATPQTPTFRTTTRLIVRTGTVKDKNGNPVEGLTAKDFIVTEDGEPQTIAFVEYQRLPSVNIASNGQVTIGDALPDAPPTAPVSTPPTNAGAGSPTDAKISAGQPGDIRYRNRRLLVLYFD